MPPTTFGTFASCSRCGPGRRAPARRRGGSRRRRRARALLEDRQHLAARRARVGGRLEHDEVTRPQPRGDLARGAADDREIGLALPRERASAARSGSRRRRGARRSRSSRAGGARRRAARASRTGRPRCSSRRGSAARRARRRRRRAGPSVRRRRTPARAARRRTRRRRWRRRTVARSSALAGGVVSGTVTARNRTGRPLRPPVGQHVTFREQRRRSRSAAWPSP